VPEIGAMIVHEVLRGLEAAHAEGIIHRDIKPENVMLSREGRVKLMDFGIARLANLESFTQTDVLIGSPLYMAPEQIEDGQVDHRADVFAAGTLLYFACTGALPFQAETAPKVLRRICAGRYQPPDQVCPATCGPLTRVIARALQTDREARYQSAAEFREALALYLADLGLVDVRAELTHWFRAPDAWIEAFRARLVPLLLERGRKLLAARQVAAGTDCLNRVLTVAPEHAEVLAVLRRSQQHARLARSAPWMAGLALAAVGLVLLATWLPGWLAERSSDRPLLWSRLGAPLLAVLPVPRTHDPREALTAPAPGRPRRAHEPRLTAVADVPTPRPATPAPAPRDQVAVTIVPFPPAVEVQVDGRSVGKGPRLDLRLAPGRHEVTLTHPSCPVCLPTSYPIEVDPKRPKHFRLAIRYEPIRLAVKGPQTGKVFVDGVLRGATNEELRVPVRSLAPLPLDVVVRWGDREEKRRVTARAGEKVSVEVPTE
jgi:hypothetical protein